jgi:hypothetical protein
MHGFPTQPFLHLSVAAKTMVVIIRCFPYTHDRVVGISMIEIPEPAFAPVGRPTRVAKVLEGFHDEFDSGGGVCDEDEVEMVWICTKELEGLDSGLVDYLS